MSVATFGTEIAKEVTIESVVALSEAQQAEIVTNLGLDPKNLRILNVQNQSLIAGIRVIYSGKVVDLSFQHSLHEL